MSGRWQHRPREMDEGVMTPNFPVLKAVLETILDVVITIDATGTIQLVNPAAYRLLGYEPAELLGKNITCLMPGDLRAQHAGFIAEYLRTGRAQIIGTGREVEAVHKNGRRLPVHLSVSEVLVDDRRLFTGVMRDMTDRRMYEERLRKERDFANSLIETANAIVLILDTDGRVVLVNRFFEELTGYPASEARGLDWFSVFLPERERDRIRDVFERALRGLSVEGTINSIRARDGSERVIAWSAKRLQDDDGAVTGILGIGNDLSELRAAEERLQQAERLAAIGRMVTTLGHESRNSLQRIQASLDLLTLDLEHDAAAMKQIQRAQGAVVEMESMFEELRNFVVPPRLELGMVNLRELADGTWQKVQEGLPVRGGVRYRSVELGSVRSCHADRARIGQVLRNLLENAVAASPEGGLVEVRLRELPAASSSGESQVEIVVCDEGPGIAAALCERVFEPFYTTKSRGTGLGMAIAKKIVDSHRGTIRVANPGAPGAQIAVRLPISGP